MRSGALSIAVAFAMHLLLAFAASTRLRCARTPPAMEAACPGVMSFGTSAVPCEILVLLPFLVATWFLAIAYILLGARWVFPRARERLDGWSYAYVMFSTLVSAWTIAMVLLFGLFAGVKYRLPALLGLIAWVVGCVLLTLGVRRLSGRTIVGRGRSR